MDADAAQAQARQLRVRRPSLGPLALAAGTAWAAALAAEQLAWSSYTGEPAFDMRFEAAAFAAVALAVALPALLSARFRRGVARFAKGIAAAALAAICVFACSMLYWGAWAGDVQNASQALQQGAVTIELTDDGNTRDYGNVSTARLTLNGRSVSVRLLWPQDANVLSAGHTLLLTGSLSTPEADDAGRWNHQQGLVGMVDAKQVQDAGYAHTPRGWVASVRDKACAQIAALPADAAGLLAGVVVGNRTLYAQSELEQDFRTCGLAHLMAVSGTHLAVVSALCSWVLARLKVKRWFKGLLLFALLGAYVALTCFAPSAMRAYAMCAAVLVASKLKRRSHAISALAACVVVFLACSPNLAFSLGFELSVLCMVGLLVLSPLLGVWLAAALPKKFAGLSDAVAATLAASLATLPATIPLFNQVPLICPLATALASPLITLALGLGIPAAVMCSVVPSLGWLMLQPAAAVASACAAFVSFLADVPMACVPVQAHAALAGAFFAAAGIALWALWPLPRQELGWYERAAGLRKTRTVVVACSILPVAVILLCGLGGLRASANLIAPGIASRDTQVVMLDVGQGDAMLVESGDAAVLVDTGQEGTVLLEALARHGITRLDAVVLSHKDADHTGALSALTGVVEVGHVYIHADLLESDDCFDVLEAASWVTKGTGAQGVRPGDEICIGSFTMRLLAPQQGGSSENDDSLIWLLCAYAQDGQTLARGLLVGDAESEALDDVLDAAGDIDFYKVGHHGSTDAISDEQMARLKPELSLISVGADNDYGHPTSNTLEVLERGGSKVLRTDLQGDVTLTFGEGVVYANCQRS